MTEAIWPSGLVAALFGLHPIHVESVAWIAERKDVLSALFWMLTLWAHAGYARHPSVRRYVPVMLFFALGLMAKPMVVTLPFVLLLLDAWPLRRLDVRSVRTSLRPLLLEKVPLFALSVASSVITFLAQRAGGTVASSARLPLADRLGNAAIAYVAYIQKTLWPAHLAAYYPYPRPIPATLVAISALVLIVATAAAVRIWPSRRYVLAGWLWYLGTLVPAIGIVQVGTQSMADRYSYLPLIGLFIVFAWALRDLTEGHSRRRMSAFIAMSVVIFMCTAATRRQVRYWESSTTLWTHALAVTTDNYAAHTYLGNALATAGDVDGAIGHYSEALRIRPDFPEAHNNIGPALASQGKGDAAIAHFTAALQLRPNYADAHNNLGVTLASQGKLDEAIAHYREAARIDPDHPHVHGNLGLALKARGQTVEALRELSLALQMNPNKQDVRTALDELRRQAGQQ
jgi:tetratricopeptide (TPR) repeat protein